MNRGLKSQQMNIFLLPQFEEDQLETPGGSQALQAHGNQHINRKNHLEENLLKLLNMKPWKVLLKVCIEGYLEAIMNPWEQSIFIISTSEMDSYTTRTMSIP